MSFLISESKKLKHRLNLSKWYRAIQFLQILKTHGSLLKTASFPYIVHLVTVPSIIKDFFENMTLLPTWWPRGHETREKITVPLPEVEHNQTVQKIRLNRKQKIFFLDTIGSLVGA
jgi:hypothetical protein